MHTNRLADEKSPYLLQHAHNPVDWYPWGEEAFDKARAKTSRSFSRSAIPPATGATSWSASLSRTTRSPQMLNRYFVPIKVDREERPDVDRIYMTVRAGHHRQRRMADVRVADAGSEAVLRRHLFSAGQPLRPARLRRRARAASRTPGQNERDRIVQNSSGDAASTAGAIRRVGGRRKRHSTDPAVLDSTFHHVPPRPSTRELGGFGDAPKFPRPVVLNFLLRYYLRARNRRSARHDARDAARHGQRRHARSARRRLPSLFGRRALVRPAFREDAVRSGAARHLLPRSFQITHDRSSLPPSRATCFDYVLRDMTHPEGGFYSAEDADSVIDPANPNEKGEGAFYIWSARRNSRELLGEPLYRDGSATVMAWRRTATSTTIRTASSPEEYSLSSAHRRGDRAAFRRARSKKSAARSKPRIAARGAVEARAPASRRQDPHRLERAHDLGIRARPRRFSMTRATRDAARRAASFILSRMYDAERATLLRRFRDGDAAIPGFLDDYAFFDRRRCSISTRLISIRATSKPRSPSPPKCATLFEDRERGRLLQHRRRRQQPGAAHEGRLRRRRAFGKLRGAARPAAPRASWPIARNSARAAERTLARAGPRSAHDLSHPAGLPQMLARLLDSAHPAAANRHRRAAQTAHAAAPTRSATGSCRMPSRC